MARYTTTHIHSSSRYDRSPATLRLAVERYIKFADIVTFTEVEYEQREQVLRQVEGWGCNTGDLSPRNDCGIIWDLSVWRLVAEGNERVADIAANGQKPVAATWAVLEHRETKRRISVIVVHAPSSVEGGNGFIPRSQRVAAWWSVAKGLRALWMRLAVKFNTDGLMVTGDWNVNIKKAVFRVVFKTTYPSLNLVWSGKNFPQDGTHHSRIIDFSLIRGALKRIANPAIFRDDDSSDHQPFIETLELTLAA
jgi:hypothetical protein